MTGGSDSGHLQSFRRDALHLLGCVAWIYICYITYGVLQEKIYLEEYGPDKKRFKFSLFLVFFQSIINGLVALIVMLATEQPRNDVPRSTYVKIGFSYIGAMFASNYALNFVSYPTQVLGKSCKLIPVMVMRVIILRHSYSLREYISVTLLTIGITFFTFFQDGGKKSQTADSAFGLVLLLISLTLDGFTGPTQEKTVAQYKPSVHQLMFYLNLYAVLGVLCVLIPNGELFEALSFLQEYPQVFTIISVFSLLSALGQYGILWTLIRFDSLTLTVVTTTRKFFTILASVIWFGHPLTFPQWIGVFCVFGGLSLEIHEKYEQKKHKKKAKIDPPSPTSPANVKKDGTTDNTKANSKSKQRPNV